MKKSYDVFALLLLGTSFSLAVVAQLLAFPPAPGIVVYGTIRDAQGRIVDGPDAMIVFRSGEKVLRRTHVTTALGSTKNYRAILPMDMDAFAGTYRSGVLDRNLPFTVQVEIGDEVFQPIEAAVGLPAPDTPGSLVRLDFNLGADSDKDGLPDEWEYFQMAAAGIKRGDRYFGLEKLRPEDDPDEDGRTNWQEYLAGTYAFFRAEIPDLEIVRLHFDGWIEVAFPIVADQEYLFEASPDLDAWLPVEAAIDADRNDLRSSFRAASTRNIRILVPPANETHGRFYRIRVR